MRLVALSQLAAWCGGRLCGEDRVVTAIGTDTRTLEPGSLYVALRGEHFDGHDFCAQAKAAGAQAVLVERGFDCHTAQIVCTDTRQALGLIARGMAASRTTCTLGITGSNGKTTTRTLTLSILRQLEGEAYSNPGNRNNEIGLPLALIEQPEQARFGIYEMGAGAPGDIAYLADIVRPKIGLVTNIAPAHLERMGSLLGVAQTKGALYEALPDDGTAVINADDAFAPLFAERAGTRRILRYGLETSAEVGAENVREDDNGNHFRLLSPWGQVEVTVPLPGRHQVRNALAAASLALAAGATLDAVRRGLAQAEGVPSRQQRLSLADGSLVLDDSYNANPGSVAVAIEAVMALAKRRGLPAWLVLGDMRELGPGGAVLHADMGRLAREAGLERVLTLGELSRHAAVAFGANGEHFASHDAVIERLRAPGRGPVVVLVKGSRGSQMERVVAALCCSDAQGGGHAA